MAFEIPPNRAGEEGVEVLGGEDLFMLHKRAQRILEDNRMNERNFVHKYGKVTVDEDIQLVKSRERYHRESIRREGKEEQTRLSEIFEAEVIQNGELSDWFGETAVTHKTSKYDDFVNGIDIIIEFAVPERVLPYSLGLSADVTFSMDATSKFDRLKRLIRKGELPELKYHREEPTFLPEVIIGTSRRTIIEVGSLWKQGKMKELARHRMQIMLLTQMEAQLEAFARYADMIGEKNIALLYRDRLEIIQEILEKKRDIAAEVAKDMGDDEVHKNIMSYLSNWMNEMDERERQVA